MMKKNLYITPQTTVVFCEGQRLAETSTWTNKPLGKENTFEEDDDLEDDTDNNVWNLNFKKVKKNPFEDFDK